VTEEIDEHYLYILGYHEMSPLRYIGDPFCNDSEGIESRIYADMANSHNLLQLVFPIQMLFWLFASASVITENAISDAAKAIRKAIEYSPNINIDVAVNGRNVTLYPAGAKILDEAVITTPTIV
jgi:hypothetical protein